MIAIGDPFHAASDPWDDALVGNHRRCWVSGEKAQQSARNARLPQHAVDLLQTRQQVIDPSRVTWVVIGDLAKIEQPIRDLKLGDVTVLDADGKKLR